MGKKGKGRKGNGKGKGLPLAMDPDTLWLQQLGVMTASDGKSGNLESRVANVMRIEDPAEQNGDKTSFDQRIQDSELEYLENSIASQTVLAENYVGLPFE